MMIMSSSAASTAWTAGRVAVVTGANKGIGYLIALQLATSGLFEHVLLACRDTQRAATAVESIKAEMIKKNTKNNVTVSFGQLSLGDNESHEKFVHQMEQSFGKVDVLVNNAAFAFKGSDPTPFEGQTKPTLDVNFRGTVDFTERMLPLLRKGSDPRIVNVASKAGYLGQVSTQLQAKFSSDTLSIPQLHELVNDFERSVHDGSFRSKGWGASNYGLSKLAVIAATKIWARENPNIAINCCCPGYCKTDMSSQKGGRLPEDGARNAVIPATMENPPSGAFFSDYAIGEW